MSELDGFGNEKLLPLAIAGDKEAVAVLKRRGNTLTPEGKLRKRTRQRWINPAGQVVMREVTVENGQVVEIH